MHKRESDLDVDVVGTSSLINISPFGEWTLKILDNTLGISFEEIEDVEIDLHLLFQKI